MKKQQSDKPINNLHISDCLTSGFRTAISRVIKQWRKEQRRKLKLREKLLEWTRLQKKTTHFNSITGKDGLCPEDGFCPECLKKDSYNQALTDFFSFFDSNEFSQDNV